MDITLGQAAVYSLIGILVVFFALALLMAIIKIMTHFTYKPAAAPAAAAASPAPASAPAEVPAKPSAPGTAGELRLYDTDERDAAVIMAIVADELQTPLNELRFKSIREVKEDEI